jgi:hypothetical protein
MNSPHPGRIRITTFGLLLTVMVASSARADSLELANGDHYRGTVISVTQSNVEFQSEMLGRITLPRDKVAHINLGEAPVLKPVTNSAALPVGPSLILQGRQNLSSATGPAPTDAVLQQMRQDGMDPKLVSQVQEQVFGQGNPVAAQKFNELMGGLMSGSLSVGDIRAQAQDSIRQIKDAKQQLGPDVGDMFDGYLAILENFVAETATNGAITSASPPAPAAAAQAASP